MSPSLIDGTHSTLPFFRVMYWRVVPTSRYRRYWQYSRVFPLGLRIVISIGAEKRFSNRMMSPAEYRLSSSARRTRTTLPSGRVSAMEVPWTTASR